MKKIWILISLLVIVLLLGYFIDFGETKSANSETTLPSAPPTEGFIVTPEPKPIEYLIPNSYLISNVPFQSQAPLGNWDALHEESCEEATLILARYWQDGKSSITAQTMENEIQQIIAWETAHGYPQDLTITQLKNVAQEYYQMNNLVVQKNVNIDDIKKAIAAGYPIIVPAAGRLLGNPNFTAPGPVYHMVLAIGYDQNNIIVQDVGTRKGDHYKYNKTIFFNAIHDWVGSPDKINEGLKNVLIIQ